jgi:hypothetical protein
VKQNQVKLYPDTPNRIMFPERAQTTFRAKKPSIIELPLSTEQDSDGGSQKIKNDQPKIHIKKNVLVESES